MRKRSLVLIATIALALLIGSVLALQWYFSQPQTTTILDTNYVVTLDPILPTYNRTEMITFTGNVTLSGNPVFNATVWIFLNSSQTSFYGLTDALGKFSIPYTGTNFSNGTVLTFTAGIQA